MNRRSFLKTLCVAAGVSLIPNLGVLLPDVPEPTKWIVEADDFGMRLTVAGSWGEPPNRILHAVSFVPDEDLAESIEYCKQALRQLYRERKMKLAA